ncbi:hypothetical protein FKW77_009892 [Venturia effusa]|uniref:LysM domain-containing protein n=1 Tax=Venturia effusa TaxID=50376 RepID=A0A517L089_9PEZI|nr:hypothetical protein FKW77_009892 [Venturia effusa]
MRTFGLLALSPALVAGAVLDSRQVGNGLPKNTIQGCDVQAIATEVENCASLARLYRLTLAQFITYNPSVGLDCAHFTPGTAYCVHVQTEPKTLVKPLPQVTKKAPGKNYGGISSCDFWQKVFPGDLKDKKKTCDGLAKLWGIDDATLHKYNTGLAPGCANIEAGSYLCMRVAQ